MKIIGVIGAMDEEIAGIKSEMEIVNTKCVAGLDFYIGVLSGRTIILVRSGIGKVNAAICTQILIDIFAVNAVINIGVAGALSKELAVGDIVISSDLVHHDLDTGAFGDPIGTVPRLGVRFFKADPVLIALAECECAKEVGSVRFFTGRIASGDQFIADNKQKERIYNSLKPLCVEMEGAAVAHCCYLNGIPFLVIRAISDTADDATGVDFQTFVKSAAERSSRLAANISLKYNDF